MNSRHYDIIRKDDKSALWLEAASDLSAAESRIAELTSRWPGEFQIMGQHSHQMLRRSLDVPTAMRVVTVDVEVLWGNRDWHA